MKTCLVCGREYKERRPEQKYCTHECRDEARKNRVTLVCAYCDSEFEVKKSIVHRSKFCSHRCYWDSGGPAKNTPIFQERHGRGERYPRVWINGKRIQRSHVVWNKHHPDDPVATGEVIHHIDGNRKNDEPSNLAKMTMGEHSKLHYHELMDYERDNCGRMKSVKYKH